VILLLGARVGTDSLSCACERHHSDIMNELLNHDIIIFDCIWRYVHDIDIAQCLVNHNVDIKNALLECHDVNIMRFLISNGADINVKNEDGSTPLHYSQSSEEVNILVSAGM
jgi:ankyrin repeat protein